MMINFKIQQMLTHLLILIIII